MMLYMCVHWEPTFCLYIRKNILRDQQVEFPGLLPGNQNEGVLDEVQNICINVHKSNRTQTR